MTVTTETKFLTEEEGPRTVTIIEYRVLVDGAVRWMRRVTVRGGTRNWDQRRLAAQQQEQVANDYAEGRLA